MAEVRVSGRAEVVGPAEADRLEEGHEVLAPALRHHGRAEHQLEDQVPADDPGDQLAQGRVGEGVRRAADRDRRGELRVAEGRQTTTDRGDHEREHHRRSGVLRSRLAGQGEDAGADDDADAEDREVQGGQVLLELETFRLGVAHGVLDGLGPQHVHRGTLAVPTGTIATWRPTNSSSSRGIRRALEDVADPAKAAPMQSYMKSEMPYRGIPSPVAEARRSAPAVAATARRGGLARDGPGVCGTTPPSARSATRRWPWPATGCIASTGSRTRWRSTSTSSAREPGGTWWTRPRPTSCGSSCSTTRTRWRP